MGTMMPRRFSPLFPNYAHSLGFIISCREILFRKLLCFAILLQDKDTDFGCVTLVSERRARHCCFTKLRFYGAVRYHLLYSAQ